MGWSEWIALGAALASSVISVISWRWAKGSAEAARHSNFLQLHSYRESLYVAFHELNGRFQVYQWNLKFDEVFAFHRHSTTCFLYVSPELAESIRSFYNKLIIIAEMQENHTKILESISQHSDDPHVKNQRDVMIADARKLSAKIRKLSQEAMLIGRVAISGLADEIKVRLQNQGSAKNKSLCRTFRIPRRGMR